MARAHHQRRRYRRAGLPYLSPAQRAMLALLSHFPCDPMPSYASMARDLRITPHRAMRDFDALFYKGYITVILADGSEARR